MFIKKEVPSLCPRLSCLTRSDVAKLLCHLWVFKGSLGFWLLLCGGAVKHAPHLRAACYQAMVSKEREQHSQRSRHTCLGKTMPGDAEHWNSQAVFMQEGTNTSTWMHTHTCTETHTHKHTLTAACILELSEFVPSFAPWCCQRQELGQICLKIGPIWVSYLACRGAHSCFQSWWSRENKWIRFSDTACCLHMWNVCVICSGGASVWTGSNIHIVHIWQSVISYFLSHLFTWQFILLLLTSYKKKWLC